MKANHNTFSMVPGGALVPTGAMEARVLSIIFIDCSDSMKRFGNAPLRALNRHIETLQGDPRQFHATAIFGFSNTCEILVPPSPVASLQPLCKYSPKGMTYLYGSVHEQLHQVLLSWDVMPPADKRNTQVIVGVFSDGEDTASPRPPHPALVQQTSRACLDEGWLLSVNGFGTNGGMLAEQLGFPSDRAKTYEASEQGVDEGTAAFTQMTVMGRPPLDDEDVTAESEAPTQ